MPIAVPNFNQKTVFTNFIENGTLINYDGYDQF